MNTTLFTAIGLMLILEGLMPLLLPQSWRDTFKKLIAMNDGQLRFIGLMSVAGGFLIILLTR